MQNPARMAPLSRKKLLLAVLYVFSAGHAVAKNGDEIVCRFLIKESPGIDLNQSERSLICSDPKLEAWSNVTDSQAVFHLKTFLKLRGYHHPAFTINGDKIVVTLGDLAVVKSLQIEGAPDNFHSEKLRRIRGETLNSKLLDSIDERFVARLNRLGYACPKQKIQADPNSGEVLVTVTPGKLQTITSVTGEPVADFNGNALRRYDAFHIGDPFQGDWLRVTENRVVTEGLLQNTHFSVTCNGDEVALLQKNTSGPPRTLAFGVGINTERGPSARASWKHLRLGDLGSNFEVAASGSFRLQELALKPKWYFLPFPSRLHFSPLLSFKHEDERYYERYNGQLQLTPGTTLDTEKLGFSFLFGPTLQMLRSVRGAGPKESNFLSLNGSARLESHDHEFFRSSPRAGFAVDLTGLATAQGVLSNVSAQLVRFYADTLINLGGYEPPFAVLGFRGAIATTFVDDAGSARLPPNFRHFLGGSMDLRGFARISLPDVNGALTSVFFSTELRLPDLLPWRLQPIGFGDAGMMGHRSATLDREIFISPGFGLRWESPIGVFRTTLARGFVLPVPNDPRGGWRVYFSFGEEF